MGSAIVLGSIEAGVASASDWVVADRSEEARARLEGVGVPVVGEIGELGGMMSGEGLMLLAVKPQQLSSVAGDVAAVLRTDGGGRSVLSILAGVPVSAVAGAVGGSAGWSGCALRAMPNTPAAIRRGTTALADLPEDATPAHRRAHAAAAELLGSLGPVHQLPESMIDAFTGIAGSGPAYVFAFTEALAAAGESLGFDRATAARIAASTVTGAAALLDTQTERAAREAEGIDGGVEEAEVVPDPGALRRAVTSKGGTTAAALEVLASRDLEDVVRAAAAAAAARAAELAAESSAGG